MKSSITEAKILFCEKCNTTVTGIGSPDPTTRVITIIEATDDLDGNAVLNSNAIFGGGIDNRYKRGVEAALMAGNETLQEGHDDESLTDEMVRVDPSDVSKTAPIKRDADGILDMTQAIMEPRVDYDVDDEYRAANGHGYDAPRIRPVNNLRGYSQVQYNEPVESDEHLEDAEDDIDDGDHNSHYEYVPMEFDDQGNHR